MFHRFATLRAGELRAAQHRHELAMRTVRNAEEMQRWVRRRENAWSVPTREAHGRAGGWVGGLVERRAPGLQGNTRAPYDPSTSHLVLLAMSNRRRVVAHESEPGNFPHKFDKEAV